MTTNAQHISNMDVRIARQLLREYGLNGDGSPNRVRMNLEDAVKNGGVPDWELLGQRTWIG